MAIVPQERRSLLSSQARVQVPWIKVTIGKYVFGVFDKSTKKKIQTNEGVFEGFHTMYPNYIQSLDITKINGQVNRYTLNITYPITDKDDPNFFEKVFSSVSSTREIIFSYGDTAMPTYIYRDEKAIITNVSQTFDLQSSSIKYIVKAVSGAALGSTSCLTFVADDTERKPSDVIKGLWLNKDLGLQNMFTGMNMQNLNKLIPGDDAAVKLDTKTNISALDYITYLVGCMIPDGTTVDQNITNDIYVLTIHDDTSYDKLYYDSNISGPYFKISKVSHRVEKSDAYTIDIGYNTSTIVTSFNIENNENYSLFYNYQKQMYPEIYTRRLNEDGQWEDLYSPTSMRRPDDFEVDAEDRVWWTKITKFPVNATITIQGLLRPAILMTYVRLNVIFPGGHKHISSGLYIVTKQQDNISGSGYRTTLSLVKISGDNYD